MEAKQDIPTAYKNLLAEFPDIDKPNFIAKPTHPVTHDIDTGTHKPITAKVRPLFPGTPKAIQGEKAWRELEKLGVIEKVDPSEANIWTSPLHFVPKPNGELRPVGDFRPLNDVTTLDGHPLPNLQHFTGHLTGLTIFSKVDIKKSLL